MSHADEGTLHAYLDGELPSAERAAVERHVAECATCRATLAEERALLERATALLGSARPVERPAPPFEQLRRVPQQPPWRVRRSFAWAASVVLALGLGYYLRNPASELAPTEPPSPFGLSYRSDTARSASQEEKAAPRIARPTGRRATAGADEVAHVERQREADSVRRPPASGGVTSAPAAQADSAAARTSMAAIKDSAPLRLDAVVVIGRAAANAAAAAPAPQDRAALSAWPTISRSTARSILGTDPVGLPGLATRSIRHSPGPDGTVVVEQAVDSATVIQIFQRPASPPSLGDSASGYARLFERSRADRMLARFVGRLRVEIAGPVSTDSLNRLLEQVVPLP